MDKYGSFNQTEHSFSRDQQRKVYVQDRILENAKNLTNGLKNEHLLVRTKNPMSKR
jgi:sulfite reductase alpha subunit-like flavoprotein